jgi:acetolactate synthase-1/2/3 large subunit
MVRQWQELFWQERYSSTPMVNPDFVKIAQAYGIAAASVEKREDLQDAIHHMVAHQGPYLLEVKVEQHGLVYPMIPAGSPISHIILGKDKA